MDGYALTQECFDAACRQSPDVMEPHVIRLMETNEPAERQEIMRAGMRETVKQRY